jgi:hypothetical protein
MTSLKPDDGWALMTDVSCRPSLTSASTNDADTTSTYNGDTTSTYDVAPGLWGSVSYSFSKVSILNKSSSCLSPRGRDSAPLWLDEVLEK